MTKTKKHKQGFILPVLAILVLGVVAIAGAYFVTNGTFDFRSRAYAPEDFLRTAGRNLTYRNQNVILRGANFDNIDALDADIGTGRVQDVYFGEADYQKLSEFGGNHVRFGMAFSWYKNQKDAFFAMLDQQIGYARKHNIWLTLNMFTTPNNCYEGYGNYCGIWGNESEQTTLKNFWVDVANRYKDEPVLAGYDFLNEPTPPGPGWSNTWFDLAQEIRDAVAAVDNNHLAFIEAGSDAYFGRIFNGNNIVYEVHDYTPISFTHADQGERGSYPGNAPTWDNKSVYWDKNAFAGNGSEYANIREVLSINWANSKNVPIYIGEWGSRGTYTGYQQYIKDHSELFTQWGVSHAFYTWKHDSTFWKWGLFNKDNTFVPQDQAKLDAAKISWQGSVKPNFATSSIPGQNPPTQPPVATQPPTSGGPAGLKVQGTTLVSTANGSKFIVEGTNIEFYRDSGCSFVTHDQSARKSQIIQKMKSLGINAVRFNYKASWLDDGSNLNDFLDFMQQFAQNGIYVMPSDHSYTGKNLSGMSSTSFPMFQAIVNGARSRGFEGYLIMNPYNEPYGSDSTNTASNWINANKETVTYLRNNLNFKGVIVLDTRGWASSYEPSTMNQVKDHDASLLGGTPNMVFSNHWYPNHDYTSRVKPSVDGANVVPVLIGELGQINPGTTGVVSSYHVDVMNNVVNTGIPKGHNGVFSWMWNWCDENSMTNDDYTTLNSYGNSYVTAFFNKVTGGSAPVVTPVPGVVTPKPATAPPVATPRPTTIPTSPPITPRPATPTPVPLPSPVGDGEGNGLLGAYFESNDLTDVKLVRVDPEVNFNWNMGTPGDNVPRDRFLVEWTGSIKAPYNGNYSFFTQADDGVRLWIDDNLVIDDWSVHSFREKQTNLNLQAGKTYNIKLRFFENRGLAAVKLWWDHNNFDKQIIPTKYLYAASSSNIPDDDTPPVPTPNPQQPSSFQSGLRGAYFNDKDLTQKVFDRVDKSVSFNWNNSSPDSRISPDTFSAEWTGYIEAPYTGRYTLYTRSDDGSRLWFNNQLIIDDWKDHPFSERWNSVQMQAGQRYPIKIQYYENTNDAAFRLLWYHDNFGQEIIPSRYLFTP